MRGEWREKCHFDEMGQSLNKYVQETANKRDFGISLACDMQPAVIGPRHWGEAGKADTFYYCRIALFLLQ